MRRPKVVALAERLGLDARAVRRMQKLRDKYGDGPLMLPLTDPQAGGPAGAGTRAPGAG